MSKWVVNISVPKITALSSNKRLNKGLQKLK
jgi:hypothetical protein